MLLYFSLLFLLRFFIHVITQTHTWQITASNDHFDAILKNELSNLSEPAPCQYKEVVSNGSGCSHLPLNDLSLRITVSFSQGRYEFLPSVAETYIRLRIFCICRSFNKFQARFWSEVHCSIERAQLQVLPYLLLDIVPMILSWPWFAFLLSRHFYFLLVLLTCKVHNGEAYPCFNGKKPCFKLQRVAS